MLPRERIPGLPITLIDRIKAVPRWAWFIFAIALLPFIMVPMVGLARYTTSSSEYCLTCHAAGDTPNKAVKSLVHPDLDKVSCVDCHAKHGQVVYEGYIAGFAAEPERVSVNCGRCHESMTQTNEVKDFKFNFGNVNVTHKSHLERGATCATCHTNIAHDLVVPQTNRPRMQNCYQCHSVSDSCTKCHTNGPPSGVLPVPASERTGVDMDGRILYQRTCSACHGSKGDQVENRPLNAQAFLEQRGDETLFRDVAEGHGIMPGFGVRKGGQLSDDQITAIVGYLKVLATTPSGPINGQAIFESRCAACHGPEGNRVSGVPLDSPEFLSDTGQALIIQAISDGRGGMPSFSRDKGGPLSQQEILAVFGYMKGLGQRGQAAGAAQGKELFAKNCASCHGEKGDTLTWANLASKAYLEGQGQDQLIKTTEEGKGGMPALGTVKGGPLSREQVTAIVLYLTGAAK